MRAGVIGILVFLSAALSGCVHLFIDPYGHVSADAVNTSDFRRPVQMPHNAPSISQGYKPGRLKGGHSGHEGIDIIDRSGTPVLAAAPGVVINSYFEPLFGNRIEISHGVDEKGEPITTMYYHLKERLVQRGDIVARGSQIGELGRTGILAGAILHLHYEVRIGMGRDNSRNPHLFWADGAGAVTCFDITRQWHDLPFRTTYPVPCKEVEWK